MKNSTRILSAILGAMLCAAAFCACANDPEPPVTDVPAGTTAAPITTTEAPGTIEAPVTTGAPITAEAPDTTDNIVTENIDTYPEELKEPFLSVIKGEKSFREGNYSTYITRFTEKLSEVAIVDLDRDGKNEVVARFQSRLIVFRDTADGVIGHAFRFQSMYDINKDGTFYWNANAGRTYGCSSLVFTELGYTTTEHYRVENGDNGEVTYYVDNKAVTEAEYNTAKAKIAKDSVVWLDIAE